ncbi:MAG TPA: GAP family protein, partial [Propionibacteriaceae bacterium]|nr:GAP family protein [Propionibacteriaceae bacterium]
RAKGAGIGFMIGWLAGIIVAIVLSSLLSSVIPPATGGRTPIAGVIKIILGALLLVLAIKQWRTRPAEGNQASLPKWMSAIDSMSAVKALWLGFLLAAANPKNLLLAIAAGVIVGGAGLPVGQLAVVIIIFVLLAASTVLVPVFGYLIASARLAGPLDKLRQWLVDNNAVIMAVLLLVLGVALIGKGFADF